MKVSLNSGEKKILVIICVIMLSFFPVFGQDPDLGPNVYIFDPSMSVAEIEAITDSIWEQQVSNEMGDERYALLFKPGVYGSPEEALWIKVGYYTQVAGLGKNPEDVTIYGHVDVYNQDLPVPEGNPELDTYFVALNNFWRSLENLKIVVTPKGIDGCRDSAMFWAASQASPMRRVIIDGLVTLMDYCTPGPQWASGGFIADSKFINADTVVNGSQQQYFIRNSEIPGWSNGVWNQVFMYTTGAPETNFSEDLLDTYTNVTPEWSVRREKPYLVMEGDQWFVARPQATSNSFSSNFGVTYHKLSHYLIADPSTSVSDINAAIESKRGVLFTPGVYDLEETISVNHRNRTLLGLGHPSLHSSIMGDPLIATSSTANNVSIAGLMLDANFPAEIQMVIGTNPGEGGNRFRPTTLSDVFFRIGGRYPGRVGTSLVVNQNNVLLDHIWAWRADHGLEGTVGWDVNPANIGVIVKGRNVTAYGLFVEHYNQHHTIWDGQRGLLVFYQNEMPYDPPSENDYGYGLATALWVTENVNRFEAYGLGSYSFFRDSPIHTWQSFLAPEKPGIQFTSLITRFLDGQGGIRHILNNYGEAVTDGGDEERTAKLVSEPW